MYDGADDASAGSLQEPLTPESQGEQSQNISSIKGWKNLSSPFLNKGQQGHSVVTKTTMEMLSIGEDYLTIASTTNI